jgi:hypothetical protein
LLFRFTCISAGSSDSSLHSGRCVRTACKPPYSWCRSMRRDALGDLRLGLLQRVAEVDD